MVDFFAEDERLAENVAGVVVRYLRDLPSLFPSQEEYNKIEALLGRKKPQCLTSKRGGGNWKA